MILRGDQYKLNSQQNVLRQAVYDLACENDPTTLMGLVDWLMMKGYSLDRLALFAHRRLGMSYADAQIAICYLLPERLH